MGALKVFDTDGNGKVDSTELQHAATMYMESKQAQKKMLYIIMMMVITIVIICGVTGCLSYVVAENTKELRAGGNILPTICFAQCIRSAALQHYASCIHVFKGMWC